MVVLKVQGWNPQADQGWITLGWHIVLLFCTYHSLLTKSVQSEEQKGWKGLDGLHTIHLSQMEPLVSLITASISILASTCCPPGTSICRIPLGKLLKQLLVSICALKRVCNCVSRCGPTSLLQQQYGLSARRADDSLSFLESLRSLMLWRRGQTEKAQMQTLQPRFYFLYIFLFFSELI